MLLRLSVPFSLLFFLKNALAMVDDNSLTKGKKKMTGVINATTAKSIKMDQIKAVSKHKGVTINDLVVSSLSTSLYNYFEGKEERVSVCLPANIRFKFYETYDEIKLENKFSCIPINIPLSKTMEDAYLNVKKVTQMIKGSLAYMYCSYAMTFWSSLLFPRFIGNIALDQAST